MRKFIGVTALLLALNCPAYAGDMPNGSPAPPPKSISAVEEPTTVAATEDGTQGTFQGGLMQTALELLALLPSLS